MASTNSGKPSVSGNGDGGAYADRILLITAIQVNELPVKKIRKVFVAVKPVAGGKRTVELEGKALPLRWDTMPSLQLDTRGDDSVVSFKLYQKRFIFFNSVLGSVERPLKDFFDPNIEGSSALSSSLLRTYRASPSEITGLHIALPNGDLVFSVQFKNDTFHAARHLIESSSEPASDTKIAKIVDGVEMVNMAMVSAAQLPTSFGDLLDSFEPFSKLLDELSKVHPVAQLVWFVVGSAYKVVKAQHERDQAVCELYITMMNTYKEACREDILKREESLSSIFDDMIKQSVECSLFISGYSTTQYLRRLTRMNISQKINEFKMAFQGLRERFTSAEIRVTVGTLLKMRDTVDISNLQKILRIPGDYRPLNPKSSCMPGTRRATLSMITEWIMGGEESVMWLSGLAGTGKSSVMGSLSDMTLRMGFVSRRAAFIRFDRAQNNDPGLFVKQLACELAIFDSRLGNAIMESARNNSGIAQHTQLSEQFSVLILDPLRSTQCEGMRDEGPITVMVDGVDECEKGEMRRQLLALLLDGFKSVPFVRLVVSSRPEEDLTSTLGDHAAHIRRVPLDITSPETKEDIRHFITTRLSTMGTELQEYCRMHDAVSQLVERASGLFIWASTVLTFIEGFPTPKRLDRILETGVLTSALEALTTLYQTALSSVASELGEYDVQSNMCDILGTIMVASESFPLVTLTGRLDTFSMRADTLKGLMVLNNVHDSDMLLSKMGALIGPDQDGVLRLLHKSFDDFLTDKARCGDSWYIDVEKHRRNMFSICLSWISPFLHEPTSLSRDVPPELPHACLYWFGYLLTLDNLQFESSTGSLEILLEELLRMYLLRWLTLCLQLAPTANLAFLFHFRNFRQACKKAGHSDLSSDIEAMLNALWVCTAKTFLHECFQWLCHQPSSSLLRQIYLPAFVDMAGGSTQFKQIIAAIKEKGIAPVGVKDPYDVEILDVPPRRDYTLPRGSSFDDSDDNSSISDVELADPISWLS